MEIRKNGITYNGETKKSTERIRDQKRSETYKRNVNRHKRKGVKNKANRLRNK